MLRLRVVVGDAELFLLRWPIPAAHCEHLNIMNSPPQGMRSYLGNRWTPMLSIYSHCRGSSRFWSSRCVSRYRACLIELVAYKLRGSTTRIVRLRNGSQGRISFKSYWRQWLFTRRGGRPAKEERFDVKARFPSLSLGMIDLALGNDSA